MLRCPRCGQEAARRSPRAGVWEHVVSVLYLYPFRCQLCSTRFRSFQRRRYTRRSQDRREYDRLAVRVPVTIVSGAERAEGETADLSLTGCSVPPATPLVPRAKRSPPARSGVWPFWAPARGAPNVSGLGAISGPMSARV